jgi:hypothetical protein
MNAGAQALLSAKLGGKDFFGYFLSHKKVTLTELNAGNGLKLNTNSIKKTASLAGPPFDEVFPCFISA